MRAALYARVSTKDGDRDPEVQLLQLRKYAQYKDYTVVEEYKDQCSGKKPILPGTARSTAPRAVCRGSPLRCRCRVRIDRIMRSLAHFLNLAKAFERHCIRLESSSDGLDYSTPNGRLMRNILASVAEFEGQLIVERTKEWLAKAAKDGRFPGRPKVEVDLEKFLEIMKQPGMIKVRACKMLVYNQGTVNNGLKEARLNAHIEKPTSIV